MFPDDWDELRNNKHDRFFRSILKKIHYFSSPHRNAVLSRQLLVAS